METRKMDHSCESDSSGNKVMRISGSSEKFVKLKVGGTEHQTTIGTLTKQESLLKSMFSGQVDVVVMESAEWVLIDRCGDHFSLILNFLRDSKVALPDKKVEVLEIMAEAEYYGLQVGISGKDSIVIAVEKKSVPVLQDDRTIRKIHRLDNHVVLAFAGLNADARVLVNMARVECQSFKLTMEDPVTVEYITKYIATTKQANATGRSDKTVREYLEKHYTSDKTDTVQGCLKLAVRALSEVVQSGAQNIEIACLTVNPEVAGGVEYRTLPVSEIDGLLKEVEAEKEQEQQK